MTDTQHYALMVVKQYLKQLRLIILWQDTLILPALLVIAHF
jgi:hypothetical protein